MLYRLLYCNHDLRDRLAKYDADAAEAGAVVREVGKCTGGPSHAVSLCVLCPFLNAGDT